MHTGRGARRYDGRTAVERRQVLSHGTIMSFWLALCGHLTRFFARLFVELLVQDCTLSLTVFVFARRVHYLGAHRALCLRCAKGRLCSTAGSHGSQGPELCTPDAVLNGSCMPL